MIGSGYLEAWAKKLYERDGVTIRGVQSIEDLTRYVDDSLGFLGVSATESAQIAMHLRSLQRDNAAPDDSVRRAALERMGPPGLPF